MSKTCEKDARNNREREDTQPQSQRVVPQHVRQRQRAVAEREASRLARPDRPKKRALSHANRRKSAVTSTPSGFDSFKRTANDKSNATSASTSTSSEWCGPFSVARQMIAAREEAKRRREEKQEDEEGKNKKSEKHPLDAIVRMNELEKKRKANPSMTWKANPKIVKDNEKDFTGKHSNLYYKRQKRYKQQQDQGNLCGELTHSMNMRGRKIPSLFDKCVQFIVDNFEHVEALGPFVDSPIRLKICEQLVASGRMNGAAFDTMAEPGAETLEITDCTQVTQDQMAEALEDLVPSGLRALLLTNCGRCFGKKVVDTIVNSAVNDLFAISISGAYVLKDADAARMIQSAAKTLSSIEFKACSMIGTEFCKSISTHFSSKVVPSINTTSISTGMGGTPLLELSLHDVSRVSTDDLKILAKSDALRNLKSISLCSMPTLDDTTLFDILDVTKGSLEAIDVSNSMNLTDETLSTIRRCNSAGNLQSLQLGSIKNFTAPGLEAFFTFGIAGIPNPPILRTLDLSDLDYESINETVIDLAITASALKQTAKGGDHRGRELNSDLSALGGVASLDVSGSSLSDKNLERLASLCQGTIKELKCNFCPLITDKGLGYLVGQCGQQLSSIEIWGNAQISDEFLDGHSRLESDKCLQIEGAWMKQSGGRSQR